jgi:prepilin-type N-terminal cleavage/methylation domain-containing protein
MCKTSQKRSLTFKAFSLIELAVVLAIMGLLIGGVMKGQALLESARLNAVVQQVHHYMQAIQMFQERFNALPGDFNHAKDMIRPDLVDGNHDGIVGHPSTQGSASGEALSFWKHLAAAGLISLPRGESLPTTKMGGQCQVVYQPYPDMPGHWLALGQHTPHGTLKGLFTPAQAARLGEKLGETDLKQGPVRAREGAGITPGQCLKSDGTLNMKTDLPACVLYVQFS